MDDAAVTILGLCATLEPPEDDPPPRPPGEGEPKPQVEEPEEEALPLAA
jgi:hypothetical protein